MSALTSLKTITLLPAEQQAVIAAVGAEDATGVLSAVTVELGEIVVQLSRISGLMPAGANQTALNTIISTLS